MGRTCGIAQKAHIKPQKTIGTREKPCPFCVSGQKMRVVCGSNVIQCVSVGASVYMTQGWRRGKSQTIAGCGCGLYEHKVDQARDKGEAARQVSLPKVLAVWAQIAGRDCASHGACRGRSCTRIRLDKPAVLVQEMSQRRASGERRKPPQSERTIAIGP